MLKRAFLILLAVAFVTVPAAAQFPRLTGFTPTRGEPGTLVALLGSNLTAATEVRIGLGSATILERYVDGIVVIVGPDATIGPIAVYTSFGQDVSFQSFQVSPRITGFERVLPEPQTPADRIRGTPGNRVAIYGANFSDSSDPGFRLGVAFGGVPAVVEVAAVTNLLVTIPSGAVSGPITVTNNAGAAVSTSDFYLQPYVASFSPARAHVGDEVTLSGVSLKGTTSVLFGTVAVVPSLVTPTNVVVTVPTITNSVRLSLNSPGGTYLTFSNLVLLPKVTGISPGGGTPGTVVTLTGSGLAGTLGLEFGGVRASIFTNVAPSTVTVVVPPAAVTGPVVLWTANGTNSVTGPFYVAPTVSGYNPVRGLPGAIVTITGKNLTGTTQVQFNGVDAQFTVLDNTRVTAVVPAGAASGPIRVTHPGGSVLGPVFQVGGREPVVTAFQPGGGPVGTQVQVNGINFTGTVSVRFGGVAVNEFSVVDDTSILARVPAGAVTGPVSVVNADGTGQSETAFVVGTHADLEIALGSEDPGPGIGQGAALHATVSNLGPLPAADVVVSLEVASGLTLVSVSVDQGTWERFGQAVTWRPGNLAPGTGTGATLVLQPETFGVLTVEAAVSSDTLDNQPGNDRATWTVDVAAPALGILAVGGSQVLLSWPVVPEGLVVETVLNPYTGLWQAVGGTPEQAGTEWQLRLPASDAARYFRLRQAP